MALWFVGSFIQAVSNHSGLQAAASECVKANWPIHNDGKSIEEACRLAGTPRCPVAERRRTEDLGGWGLFLNVFWHHSLRPQGWQGRVGILQIQ